MLLARLIPPFGSRCRPALQIARHFYDASTKFDTIFAPATAIQPVKGSALSIIRLSGNKTEEVLRKLVRFSTIRNESDAARARESSKKLLKPRQAKLAKIFDPDDGELVDVGLVLWFPAPNSYTGEDVCEFHVHGSHAILNKLLNILGEMKNLRPAEPGEFTRRALKRGKMSLVQVESLPELISAQTDEQRKFALRGLSGSTQSRYDGWISDLVRILAHLEASIDFGEDELIGEQRVVEECVAQLNDLSKDIEQYISLTSRCKNLIRTGARVAILGRPNAGKSTFMNLLCRKKRSIVSDLSGTTRDVVEYSLELGGHALTLSDTAGLRSITDLDSPSVTNGTVIDLHNAIEREGMRRALEVAKEADLLIYLVDGSKIQSDGKVEGEFLELMNVLGNGEGLTKSTHLVINKMDLNRDFENSGKMNDLRGLIKAQSNSEVAAKIKISFMSCKTQENFEAVLQQIISSLNELHADFVGRGHDRESGLEFVNERHLSLLRSTERHLRRASRLRIEKVDEMAQHVRESVDYLSRIVGRVTNEQVLDIIFRDFCIGK